MGLLQTRKLLHDKGKNQWREEITYRMRVILANYTSNSGLISKINKNSSNLIAKSK